MTPRDTDSKNRLIWIWPVGLSLLVASGVYGQVPLQTEHSPAGWFLAGGNHTNYRTGVDRAEMHGGLPSAYLVSSAKGTCSLGMVCSPTLIQGKTSMVEYMVLIRSNRTLVEFSIRCSASELDSARNDVEPIIQSVRMQ